MNNLPRIPATLVQLRSFEAVARLGGVVRAAESLHIAQPTLSTQLRELSASLGMTLFEPRGRWGRGTGGIRQDIRVQRSSHPGDANRQRVPSRSPENRVI